MQVIPAIATPQESVGYKSTNIGKSPGSPWHFVNAQQMFASRAVKTREGWDFFGAYNLRFPDFALLQVRSLFSD